MRLRIYHLALTLVFAATVDYRFFASAPGVPSITLLEVIAALVVLLSLGVLLTRPEIVRQAFRVVLGNIPVFGLFCWIALVALANLTITTTPAAAFKDLAPGLVLFFFVALSIRRPEHVRGLLAAYLSGCMVQVLLGTSQVLFGGPRPVALAEAVEFKTQADGSLIDISSIATGLFTHPNGLAIYLIPATILLVAHIAHRQSSKYKRIGMGLLLALSIFTLWNTQAKGAFAWLAIGLGLLLFQPLDRWRSYVDWAALAIGIVAIVLTSQWLYQELGQLGTVISRIQLAEAALTALWDNQRILAIGGGSEAMFAYSTMFSNMEYPSAHNTYLDIALLFGLPGLLLYLAVARTALRRAALIHAQSHPEWILAGKFVRAAMVAILGMYFFEPALALQYQVFFFLLAAAAAAIAASRSVTSANTGT